jgi:alkyldihydroxyacetonephosphate synthase
LVFLLDAISLSLSFLAHFSHAYVDGCSIYFTILSRTGEPERDRERYKDLWNKAMEEALQVGATISHHHGIGLLKAKFLPQELATGMEWYRSLKHELDPKNLMNPGKMGL